jgi:acetoin utilization protein AcuB
MQASQIMTRHPVTIRSHAPVKDAITVLERLDIRHLPVVGETGEIVGMISDRDLRRLSVPVVDGDEYQGTVMTRLGAPVSSIMSTGIVSVEPQDDISTVVDRMLEHNVGAVAVVQRGGRLVGVVSYVDVLRDVARQAQRRAA